VSPETAPAHAEQIVAASAAMKRILRLVERIAPTESNILLTGESGTGKEKVARLIHYQSKRSRGPFVAVNMAAIPETLIESEMFGHVRGRSPTRAAPSAASSSWPTRGRSSSMRSPRCPRACR